MAEIEVKGTFNAQAFFNLVFVINAQHGLGLVFNGQAMTVPAPDTGTPLPLHG